MNRTKAYPFVFLVFFFLTGQLSHLQAQVLLKTLNTYNESYPEEKIHVHFDKQAYSAGETVWFKAYLLAQGLPSLISTDLHTELLDSKGVVIAKKVFPIYESTAAGSFDLPANQKDHNLLFRAYTTWMENFDTAFLYVKRLPLANKTTTIAKLPIQLRFFPEGGDMIADFESVIAFKATANDLPVRISGTIKDEAGKIITTFKTAHDGMGKFKLEATPNAKYYAEWKDETGSLRKTPLPQAKATGTFLHVEQSANYVAYVIKRSQVVTPSLQKVNLIAQMQQQVVYRATINLEKTDITSGAINTDSLTTGILQITLFDKDWKPLSERIVFVNRADYDFETAVNPYSKNLGKRTKNVLEIVVPDTFKTNLSISVTDGQLPAGDDNIFSCFLLTADLRGYIHNPAYYFSGNADSVKEHLDLLMLTNGWRRYNWEALAAGQLPPIKFPKDNYMSVKGKIYGAAAGDLAASPQLNLFLVSKDSSRRFVTATAGKNGEFATEPLLFFDTVTVFYQFNKADRLNRSASVDFSPVFANHHVWLDSLWAAQAGYSLSSSPRVDFFARKLDEVTPLLNKRMKTLQEVIVQSKVKTKEQELEKKYVSGLFQSGNSHSFNLIDDPFAVSAFNIFTYLQGKVAGLQITGTGNNYTVNRRGSTPAFFVNEMPVDADYLSSISVSDVAYIKVIDPPFVGATGGGAGGAIAIYTRKGGDSPKSSDSKGLSKGQVIGYASLKQFYSPDYAHTSLTDDIEDVRSTLYWNPYILTDKTARRVKVEFYNNDLSTSHRVVLEGFNEAGKLTRVEKIIQ
ncbi:MAG: hypothetical protein JWP88_1879 [Flaviaesturariibacter sp.]|nr:hypothetical protein [Flaviaesturariibacter sp.]